MFPGTSPKYEDIFYVFFISFIPLYNDDILFARLYLKKESGFLSSVMLLLLLR